MAGEYVLPPDDVAPYDPRVAAQAVANDYLVSRGEPGYSAAPPAPAMSVDASGPPAPPPELPPAGPPPPPSKWERGVEGAGRGLKNAGTILGATVLGGPVGGGIALQRVMRGYEQPGGATKEEGAPPPAEPAGPPPPPMEEDRPIILGGPGGGQARLVSPAGMYPHSMTTQAHMGRPVPEESKYAFGAATEMQLQGAEKQAAADHDYYNQVRNAQGLRMQAAEDAATQHARVSAERDAEVKRRLAEIESINSEANAEIDPNKFWNDRGAGAKVLGGISIALGGFFDRLLGRENGALKIIESGINQEIQAQLSNRQLAGQKLKGKERLLDLHLQRLGDKDKAIDATRLAIYDNVLGQMDQYAAENKARVSEAALLNAKGAILEKRGELVNKMGLQESDDINKQYSEQYRNAVYSQGSGGTKYEGPKHVITIPASDGTREKATHVAVDEKVYAEMAAMQGGVNALVELNKKALKARAELRALTSWEAVKNAPLSGDRLERVATLKKQLNGYNNERAVMAEKAKDPNSAVREPEFQRALESGVDYTAGFNGKSTPFSGDVEKLIEANSNTAQRVADAKLRGVTGQVVRQAIARDPNGFIKNEWLPNGELYEGRAIAPEKK